MQATPHEPQDSDLPAGLAQPARRALIGAGYLRLEQLTTVPEDTIRRLHGIGPRAMRQLREALSDRGWSFAGPPSTENTD